MSILVTGGAGFIGAEVIRVLLEKGEKSIAVFSRNPSLASQPDIDGRVDVIRGDAGNFSHVLDAVKQTKPETIYHFGAMLSLPSEADPSTSVQSNVMGTFHVLEAARLFGVRQVIFASSGAVYGSGIEGDVIDDFTLQRPGLLYGVTKVFGENLGLFYKRKYDIDFRTIRFPSIVGPGARTPGIVQFTSWMIEESAKGNPYKVHASPERRVTIVYIKEAGMAAVRLAETPIERIKMVNYNLAGVKPTPSAGEMAEIVKENLPDAQIVFDVDEKLDAAIARSNKEIDDTRAREEWGWNPTFTYDQMVKEVIREVRENPGRYA